MRNTSEVAAQFRQMVRERRQERGLTQDVVAARVGTTRGYISKVEKGHVVPMVDQIERLALALKISPHGFFGGRKYERDPFLLELAQYVGRLTRADREYVLSVVLNMAVAIDGAVDRDGEKARG